MLYKNLPHKGRTHFLVVRRLYDTLALAVELIKGNWGAVKAIWRAHRDFSRMCHEYDTLPSPDGNLLETMPEGRLNIIWQYYGRGRHTFAELPQ